MLVEQFIAGAMPRYRGTIRIDRSFTAAEDLALPGTTVFEHDVNMENFILRIAGSATFHGSVNNAIVLALGEVDIKGESKNCHIFALSSLSVAQSDSSILMSCGNMSFETDVLRTSAAAAGSISGLQASVYSGILVAGSDIAVLNAHCLPDDPPVSLVCGSRTLSTSATQLEAAYINRLLRLRKYARVNHLTDDMEAHLAYIHAEIDHHRTAVETLRQQTEHSTSSSITVQGRTDKGVTINISGRLLTVEQNMESVAFSLHNDDIAVAEAPQNAPDDQMTYIEL